MKELTVEEKKQLSLDILSEVDKFCRENNIEYFLQFGTLLGAVRHKGFIPWDDDIDISMPRPDYERFLKVFNSENLEITNYRKSGYYPMLFSKVYSKKTVCLNMDGINLGYGVAIDIFPIDGISDDKNLCEKMYEKYQFWYKLYNHSSLYKYTKYKSIKRKFIDGLIYVFFPYKKTAETIEKITTKVSYQDAHFATSLMGSAKLRIISKQAYETEDMEFEGYKFKCPKGYDEILRVTYGPDYMTPPPVDKRQSIHDEAYYWK